MNGNECFVYFSNVSFVILSFRQFMKPLLTPKKGNQKTQKSNESFDKRTKRSFPFILIYIFYDAS